MMERGMDLDKKKAKVDVEKKLKRGKGARSEPKNATIYILWVSD